MTKKGAQVLFSPSRIVKRGIKTRVIMKIENTTGWIISRQA
jgi:hypothetical protein